VQKFPRSAFPHHWEAIATDCINTVGFFSHNFDPLAGVRAWNAPYAAIATVELDDDPDLLDRLKEGLHTDSIRLAAIDMSGSNIQIKRDFAQWLTLERKRRGVVEEPATASDRGLWADSRAIPYIDICQFASVTGVRFSAAAIQHALFGANDTVRAPKDVYYQSMLIHAKALLSRGLLRALASEYGYERLKL
jgi:hypothetical protein